MSTRSVVQTRNRIVFVLLDDIRFFHLIDAENAALGQETIIFLLARLIRYNVVDKLVGFRLIRLLLFRLTGSNLPVQT